MPPEPRPLRFDLDGSALFAAALDEAACGMVEAALAGCPTHVPGVRLAAIPALAELLSPAGAVGQVAAFALDADARPVWAVLFDKTAARNWALGWHQDRTIVVERREEVPGFGPWTVKAGLTQVEPPFPIIERMVTLRIHLDPVNATNAPLRIVPGSHRLGRIPESGIAEVVGRMGERSCHAARGDIWLYATSIVHCSSIADPPGRRRVLQVDYAADPLPEPLRWRGV